jgi:NAD-dependent DNA ligase
VRILDAEQPAASSPVAGKTAVFTGSLAKMMSDKATEMGVTVRTEDERFALIGGRR